MVTKRINFLEVSCFLAEVFQLLMGQQGNRTLLQAFLRWMVRGAAEFWSKHPDGRFFPKVV